MKIGFLLALLWATAVMAAPGEDCGRRIFMTGTSPSGEEITALVGKEGVPVPASAVPCAGCHGRDGLGRPEGSVIPSNITWSHLTKPYGGVSPSGRRFPPYTESSLKRAVTEGLDPAGQALDAAMPRFRMSPEDLDCLVAFIKHLEHELDPGLSDDAVVIGSVLPGGRLRPLGDAIEAVLKAYIGDINQGGGLYGRRVILKVERCNSPQGCLEKIKAMTRSEEVFAIIGAFIAGIEEEALKAAEESGTPLVGPITSFPEEEGVLSHVFFVEPGLLTQGLAMIDFAETLTEDVRPAIIFTDRVQESLVKALAQRIRRKTGKDVPLMAIHSVKGLKGKIALLKGQGTNVLLFLGRGSALLATAEEAQEQGWTPYIFLFGHFLDRAVFDLPELFEDKVFVSFTAIPQSAEEFLDFRKDHSLPGRFMPFQIIAYASAKIFEQGLKRAGRRLDREKFIAALESLYRYDVSVIPPVTYHANRHIALSGAFVVGVDLASRGFAARPVWVEASP
ncbi:MAG: hypothetical protein D6819_03265 [Gammaproteobacteria bacterium]|nr:MAG: hypothetical protein D6819_03265 [Gammaproteobacteria bacterium]